MLRRVKVLCIHSQMLHYGIYQLFRSFARDNIDIIEILRPKIKQVYFE